MRIARESVVMRLERPVRVKYGRTLGKVRAQYWTLEDGKRSLANNRN